jgi:biopolymer transport protein TolQ
VDRSVTATDLGGAMHDLSLWGLFLQADWVVKLVMLGLLLASVWVWAIVFEKVTSIRRANKAADAFEDAFWSGGAQRLGGSDLVAAGLKERIDRTMAVTVQREMERLERWMIFLASVGSVAPFIGLFGTVWGIMNSFAAIAGMQNTNLAVVAPGIAEALFATAIGLVAAIPAVLAYNKISSDLARFASRMEGFASEFGAILSRQTETAVAEPGRAAAPVAE